MARRGVQDLQESRRTLVIISLITPLSLTSNEAARETRPWNSVWKRRVPRNPIFSFVLTVNADLLLLLFILFKDASTVFYGH